MADRIFTGPGNFNDATKWDGGVAVPAAGDNLQITTGTCTLTANDANVYGILLIDAGIIFTIQTYNFSCGAITNNGNLTIGISAGTGLTCAGITFGAAGFLTCYSGVTPGSKMTNSGDFDASAIDPWGTHNKLIYTQSGNGTMKMKSYNAFMYSTTINVSCRLTIGASSYLGSPDGGGFTLNGELDVGATSTYIGAGSSFNMSFGASSDIIGTGTLIIYSNAANYVSLKTNAFTLSGRAELPSSNNDPMTFPAMDFSNADVTIYGPNSLVGAVRRVCNCGANVDILKAKTFKVSHINNVSFTFTTAMTNPSFIVSGAILIDQGTGTITYTKGTGSYTLIGGNANINFLGKSVEAIIINCTAGQTKTCLSAFTTLILRIVSGILALKNGVTTTATDFISIGGILKSDSNGNRANLTVTNYASASISNISIQDIDAVNPLDAYNSNDLGNNLDITFVTTPRSEICLVKVGF